MIANRFQAFAGRYLREAVIVRPARRVNSKLISLRTPPTSSSTIESPAAFVFFCEAEKKKRHDKFNWLHGGDARRDVMQRSKSTFAVLTRKFDYSEALLTGSRNFAVQIKKVFDFCKPLFQVIGFEYESIRKKHRRLHFNSSIAFHFIASHRKAIKISTTSSHRCYVQGRSNSAPGYLKQTEKRCYLLRFVLRTIIRQHSNDVKSTLLRTWFTSENDF